MIHRLLPLAAALLALGVHAQNREPAPAREPAPSKEQYRAQMKSIEAEYDHGQSRCKPQLGNAKEVCREKARAGRDIAAAELQFRFEPTTKNDEKLRVARAEAAYAVSRQRCGDLAGQSLDACRDEAKGVLRIARAEAKLQAKSGAEGLKSEQAVRDKTALDEQHRDSLFAGALERCGPLGADAREDCVINVRKRFGKL